MPVMNGSMYCVFATYYKTGHAVVDHLVGRYIQEIAFVSGEGRYIGGG